MMKRGSYIARLGAALMVACLSLPLGGCLDRYFFKPDYTLHGAGGDAELQKEMQAFFKQRVRAVEMPPEGSDVARQSEYQAELMKGALEKKLRAEGYYEGVVTLRRGDAPWEAQYNIDAGPLYKIRAVTVTPAGAFSSDLSTLKALEGAPLHAQTVLAAQSDFYRGIQQDKCYFHISIDHGVILDRQKKMADIEFTVSAGPPARLGKVRFSRNRTVKDSYLQKLVPWKEGDCFERGKIDDLRGKLFEGGLFSGAEITLPEAPPAGAQVDIDIKVTERAHRSVTAGVSYYSDEGAGLTLGWKHRNLLGAAETLEARLKASTLNQSLQGQFAVPFFLRKDQTLSINAEIGREDTDAYLKRGIEGGIAVKRNLTRRLSASTGVSLSLTRIFDNATLQEDTFGLVSFPQTATYDSRDDRLDPSRGWLLEGTAEPFLNTLGAAAPFVKVTASAKTYIAVHDDTVLALRAKWGTITGADLTDVPATERFYGGGSGSVRGFGYQEVGPQRGTDPTGGRAVAEASAEVRYKITDDIGAVAFLDAGNVSENVAPDLGDMSYGAGLGLRYYTAVGPLRLDVAVPLNDDNQTSNNFEVYLSVGQAF